MNKAIDNSDKTKVNIYTEDFVLIGETYLNSHFSQYEENGEVKLNIKSFYHPVLYLNHSILLALQENTKGPLILYLSDVRFFAPKKIKAVISRFNEPDKTLLESYEVLELTEEDFVKIKNRKAKDFAFLGK